MKRADTNAKHDDQPGDEHDRQRHRLRTWAIALIAAGAAAALIAVTVRLGLDAQESAEPAQTPTPAEQVAADFLDAYAAADSLMAFPPGRGCRH